MSSRVAGSAEGPFASVNPDSPDAAANSARAGATIRPGTNFQKRFRLTGSS